MSVNYTLPPYAVAYPAIVDSLAFHPCVPVRANVSSNTCVWMMMMIPTMMITMIVAMITSAKI
jgi:hypothetical protein